MLKSQKLSKPSRKQHTKRLTKPSTSANPLIQSRFITTSSIISSFKISKISSYHTQNVGSGRLTNPQHKRNPSSHRCFSDSASSSIPSFQTASTTPINISLSPPSLFPATDQSDQTSSVYVEVRPNPTTQKLDYLNKRILSVQRHSPDLEHISSLIPDLNATENTNDFFETSTPYRPFDPQLLSLIPMEHAHTPQSRINSVAREKNLNSKTDQEQEINSDISISTPTAYKSKLDQLFRYEDQNDSFLYKAVDPFEQRAKQHERNKARNENTSQNRSRSRQEEQELLEKQRQLGERDIEHVDTTELSNDIANRLLQTQALSAFVMQNKANHAPPGARPVFWHGTIPYSASSSLLPGLPSLTQASPDLDWRTFLDLSQPHLWYPTARLLKRKIVFHTGPTNSGKTHRAMMRLKEAESGLYCGPLRLLAWENYEKLNNQGVPCSLLTGQEVVETPKAQHVSSTVEMVSLDRVVDVAVIDEIQMIQDRDRGFAWTRAFLGIPAKEIHLAGDATALQWLQHITAITGEELHIAKYDRLSPLTVENHTVNGYKNLRQGDCVVAFSRKEVYSIKKKIEFETGKKCAIIYGNLPPDIRKQQAQLFNQGELDFLVASDAIGMGLNLNMGRVIFSTIVKFDGEQFRRLLQTEVLQIAGRAGRFNTQFHHGYVNVMHVPEDLEYVRQQFQTPLPPMEKAQLFPSTEHLLAFCEKFPQIKLSNYLGALPSRAKTSKLYDISTAAALTEIAEAIDDIEMPAYNRVMLCYAPLSLQRYKTHPVLLKELAENLVKDEPIAIPKVAYASRPAVPKSPADVALLEETFSNLEAYIWLWYRMGDQMYMHRQAKLDRESCQRIILHYLINS